MRLGESRISVIYLIVCSLWIAVSDRILFLFRNTLSPTQIELIATGKGIFFILITSVLIWYLIRLNNKRLLAKANKDIIEKQAYEAELKRLNNEILAERNKLSESQQIAKVGGWEFYIAEQRLVWSDEMYMIAGIPPDSDYDLYQLYLQQIYPEDRQAVLDGIEQLIFTGKQLDVVHRTTLLTGETRYIRQMARLAQTEDGVPYKLVGSAQDVTELKLLEQERNKYMFNLEDMLNSINEGFYTLNHDLVFTKINKKFEVETGFTGADVLGRSLLDLFPGMEGRLAQRHFNKAMEQNIPVRFEAYWRLVHRWYYVEAYPTPEGMAVYFVDITDKKEKDILLKSAVSRYETVSKATKDVIYDYDLLNDEITFYTDVSELLCCDLHEIGTTVQWWRSYMHPDDVKEVVESQQRVLDKGETNWKCEYRIRCAQTGNYKYVYSQGYYIYNSDREAVRIIGAVRDIDELKRANEENKRLAEIVTKINNLVYVMDTDNLIVWANKAFEDHTGYTLEEIKGQWPKVLLGGDKLPPELINEILTRKGNLETFALDMQHHLKDGRTQWVNAEYTPLFDNEGVHTGYIAVHKDISERKAREEKIYQQNKVLQEISWLSSHEFRRPVASILGLAYLAKDSKAPEDREPIIDMITTCAEELDGIVHDITNKISTELYTGKDSIELKELK